MSFNLGSSVRVNVLIVSVWLATLVFGQAQSDDGQRKHNKSGIALIKPQAWSQNEQATVLEFTAFIDRSVKTHPGAGYFEFRTAKSPNYQVPASRVVRIIIFPDVPEEIVTAEQRTALQKSIEEFQSLGEKFPAAARVLQPPVEQLRKDASKYDSGYVKANGQWIARPGYFKQKANALVEILNTELTTTQRVGKMTLESNQYFRGLLELAKTEPSIQPLVESVRTLHAQLVRKEQRAEILAKLRGSDQTFSEAEFLVNQLKSLQPLEDPEASKFVQSWDAAVTRAAQLTKQITELQSIFELEIAQKTTPPFSPKLSGLIQQVVEAVNQFYASSPPAAIQVPKALVDAMSRCIKDLPSVKKQMEARQYLEAKTLLDPLVRQASTIGLNSASVLGALQRKVTGEVERFQNLRDEAKILAESDKIEEAIKKYEEAFAVIPEKDITVQIEALKKQQ